MKIIYRNIEDLNPYENNPRMNNQAVEYVKKSIQEFGFKIPIIIDKNNTIVCGHTRYKACKDLDIYKIPCIMADDLTDKQIKAFRLADNKSSELAVWDSKRLEIELQELTKSDELNIKEFGFLTNEQEFFKNDTQQEKFEHEEDNEEYNNFLDKFKDKLTTDDCFTPPNIYAAVADFVETEYNVKKENFVRPFYPGGDFENYKYKDTDIVVDNPPFSLFAKIINFYLDNNIKFFIFGDGMTTMSAKRKEFTCIAVGEAIEYQNGAKVSTSFITNMDNKNILIRTSHRLTNELKRINKENSRKLKSDYKKYSYPKNILGIADIKKMTRNKEDLFIKNNECEFTDYLYTKDGTKTKQYGTKLIVSDEVTKRIEELKVIDEEAEENEQVIELFFNKEQEKILKELNKK